MSAPCRAVHIVLFKQICQFLNVIHNIYSLSAKFYSCQVSSYSKETWLLFSSLKLEMLTCDWDQQHTQQVFLWCSATILKLTNTHLLCRTWWLRIHQWDTEIISRTLKTRLETQWVATTLLVGQQLGHNHQSEWQLMPYLTPPCALDSIHQFVCMVGPNWHACM